MDQEGDRLLVSRRTVLKSVGAMGAGLMLKDLAQAETGTVGEKGNSNLLRHVRPRTRVRDLCLREGRPLYPGRGHEGVAAERRPDLR